VLAGHLRAAAHASILELALRLIVYFRHDAAWQYSLAALVEHLSDVVFDIFNVRACVCVRVNTITVGLICVFVL
jgi:hypothetical protein